MLIPKAFEEVVLKAFHVEVLPVIENCGIDK
jgi:hypothetical protein